MTEQTKAKRMAERTAQIAHDLRRTPIPLADFIPHLQAQANELRRLDANEAELLGALMAAANYIDTLGGVSKGYRTLITRIEAGRNAK